MEFVIPSNLISNLDHVFIDVNSKDSNIARRVQKYFPESKISFVTSEPFPERKGKLSSDEFNASKRNLFITPYPGAFFKRCPGATQKKVLTCCNYHVLNLGSQCNMNCSYCYLQSYLNSPVMKIFSNIDQALLELKSMADEHGDKPFRVGTGEVIDSLSMDEITLYSRELIEFFRQYPQWILEFKTKSATVDQFLDLGPAPNVVVSWSINAPQVIEREEHGTARFHERIAAARKCRDRGFKIAFHIDPMIWHSEWKENYSYLVRELTTNFSAEDIHVVSLGTLRFQPEQRFMMRERFGMKSLVNQAEMFPSDGGKLRYDMALRAEMFQFMKAQFAEAGPGWKIFLCMETPETWISTFEATPMQRPELKELFRPLPRIR